MTERMEGGELRGESGEGDVRADARMDEATYEPEAHVENSGRIEESEAIEQAVVDLVDAVEMIPLDAQADETPDAEDPARRYGAVELTPGAVLQDEDWNEGGGSPAGTVAKVDSFTQEAGTHTRAQPEALGMDFKPVPAAQPGEGAVETERTAEPATGEVSHNDHWSSEVALDGKGGAPVTPMDGERAPGEEAIDTVEEGSSGVDFELFRETVNDGIAVPREAIEAVEEDELSRGSRRMEEVLGRAVTDPAFRAALREDAEAALEGHDLTPEVFNLLTRIDPDRLEQLAGRLHAQFEDLQNPATQEVLKKSLDALLQDPGPGG